MRPRIVLCPKADLDLERDALYISENHPSAAARFLDAAHAEFKRLAEMPGMGRRREVSAPGLQGLRSWRIKGFEKWLIFYRPIEAGIEVVRVLHGAQDVESILEAEGPSDD